MLIIPAIDLKDGKVVRYTRGRTNKKIYSANPVEIALAYQMRGAKLLHVVDLDGAFTGRQKNLPWIKKIINAVKIPVEVGGGLRDMKAVEKIIAAGTARAVLGTRAIEDIEFLKSAIRKYRSKIAVALDASKEQLTLYGWKRLTNMPLRKILASLESAGLKTIIYTDTSRDGTLKGIDLKSIKAVLKRTKIDLIVSGGVSTLSDIKKLLSLKNRNLKGVIIGKALYEGRFSLQEALNVCWRKELYPALMLKTAGLSKESDF